MSAETDFEDIFLPLSENNAGSADSEPEGLCSHPQVNAACQSGDVSALRTLFAELKVQPDHDKRPKTERPPIGSVEGLLYMACTQPAVCEFLNSYFDTAVGIYPPIREAIEKANLELLRAIGKLYQRGLDSYGSELGLACSVEHDPMLKSKIIKVMLESGADPNASAQPHEIFPTVVLIIMCGVPDTTMEDFFDHGYSFEYAHIDKVMKYKRAGILEVMYRRGRQMYPNSEDLPLPGPKQLMKMCKATKDDDMVAMARKVFPDELGKKDRSLLGLFKRPLSGL